MSKIYEDVITEALGVEPILINSALVSAQERQRLYWTNIPNVTQPEDKQIVWPGLAAWSRSGRYRDKDTKKRQSHKGPNTEHFVEERTRRNGKANTLVTGPGCAVFSSTNYIELKNGSKRILLPEECELLQTLPEGYTEGISINQRYKALGNGFTVDVIAHILKGVE